MNTATTVKLKRPTPSSATAGSVADLRTVSDLLAAALVGEYPAEAALERYCATLARPYDVQVVMAKFRSKPQNGQAQRPEAL